MNRVDTQAAATLTPKDVFARARCISLQRKSNFLFEVCSIDPFPKEVKFFVHMELLSGANVEIEADHSVAPELVADMRQFATDFTGRNASLYRKRRHKVVFQTKVDEDWKVRRVFVEARLNNQAYRLSSLSRNVSLGLRIPLTADEFIAHLTFQRVRHHDTETVFRGCSDILSALSDTEDPQVFPYIANAFVILIYKAIELNADDIDSQVSALGPRLKATAERLEIVGKGVRENRFQILTSIDTALWHFWVFRQNAPAVLETLEGLVDKYTTLTETFKITYALNLTLGILALAVHELCTGEISRSRRLCVMVYDIFRQGASAETRHVIWFRELAVSHQSALYALQIIEAIQKSAQLEDAFLDEVAGHCARVKTADFTKKLRQFICGPDS